MSITPRNRRFAISAACAVAMFPAPAIGAEFTGPNSSAAPYLKSVAPGVDVTSLITVGDRADNGYRMVGIPDGIGVRREGRSLQVSMNHELRPTVGIPRAHGQAGAFVSQWDISASSRMNSGRDLIQPGVQFWDYVSQTTTSTASAGGPNPRETGDVFPAQTQAFARFCSASLATPAQLRGTGGRGLFGTSLFFANEESGNEGRVFGVTDDGTTKQLPRLGLFSWENTQMATTGTNSTVTVAGEDGGDAQLWIYNGRKQRTGDAFRRAGLTNGTNHVLDIENQAVTNDASFRSLVGKGVPTRFGINGVDWDQSGERQNAEAKADGLTLNRIEDLHFDPRNPNVLYFVTTEGGGKVPAPGTTSSRDGGGLWRVTFDDIDDPSAGGTLELVLDGSEAPYLNKPDNIGIDTKGNLLIQEDPGGNPHLARIIAVDLNSGARAVLAQFDPALFSGPGAITQDEESSGIEDTGSFFGHNSFVLNAQVHKASPDPELVELGQMLSLQVKNWKKAYASGVAAG